MVGMVKRLVQGTLACLCAGEVILSAQELGNRETDTQSYVAYVH